MTTPTETVLDFVRIWEGPSGFSEAVKSYFTPETVWENHGMMTTTGVTEALDFMGNLGAQMGLGSMKVDMLALAEAGNAVLTERIDHMFDEAGNTVLSIRLMGIFEVAEGKITAWRDYFDTAGLAPSN